MPLIVQGRQNRGAILYCMVFSTPVGKGVRERHRATRAIVQCLGKCLGESRATAFEPGALLVGQFAKSSRGLPVSHGQPARSTFTRSRVIHFDIGRSNAAAG